MLVRHRSPGSRLLEPRLTRLAGDLASHVADGVSLRTRPTTRGPRVQGSQCAQVTGVDPQDAMPSATRDGFTDLEPRLSPSRNDTGTCAIGHLMWAEDMRQVTSKSTLLRGKPKVIQKIEKRAQKPSKWVPPMSEAGPPPTSHQGMRGGIPTHVICGVEENAEMCAVRCWGAIPAAKSKHYDSGWNATGI